MIIIKCTRCKRKILKYKKISRGRVIRCYKDRIMKIYPIQDQQNLQCLCGEYIGVDEGKWFKMKQNTFEYSGTINKK
jgi:DNA-directed RNA polymerase subunit RPC12/RpoP